MMKLLQINTVINSGSTGRIAEDIGRLAISNGWKSYIAYGRNTRESHSELIRIGSQCDVYQHVFLTRLFDSHGLGSVKATIELVRHIDIISPDIIHLHNIHGYYVNIKILFEYLATLNKPIIWTLHDCWSFTGHCSHFDFVRCKKWKSTCFNCPQIKEYPASFFIDRSQQNFILKKRLFTSLKNLTLVPVSYWLNDILKQSFLSNLSSEVIYNGIDTTVFNISPYRTKHRINLKVNSKFVILGVASVWNAKKGLDDFIKLSHLLSQDFQIVLVGLSSKQLKKIPTNIIGIRRTENIKQLAELYSVADVFVNPTWEDNFPTTNLEALACGTPIITYRTGGSVEAVSFDTGFIVEKGNLSGIIDAVYTIKQKGKSFYELACRDRAEKYYDKNDRFNQYIDLYTQLLNS